MHLKQMVHDYSIPQYLSKREDELDELTRYFEYNIHIYNYLLLTSIHQNYGRRITILMCQILPKTTARL